MVKLWVGWSIRQGQVQALAKDLYREDALQLPLPRSCSATSRPSSFHRKRSPRDSGIIEDLAHTPRICGERASSAGGTGTEHRSFLPTATASGCATPLPGICGRDGLGPLLAAVDAINQPLKRMLKYLNAVSGPDTSIIAVEYAGLTQGTSVLGFSIGGGQLGTVFLFNFSGQGESVDLNPIRMSRMPVKKWPLRDVIDALLHELTRISGLTEVADTLRSSHFTTRQPNVSLAALAEESVRRGSSVAGDPQRDRVLITGWQTDDVDLSQLE